MEQFANVGSAILNNGTTLSSGATTTTVSTPVNVPSSGVFRILIDSELIKVTAVSGSVWTLVRGDGGTSAASHTDGTTAYIVVTKEALDALVSIQAAGTEISTRRVLNFSNARVSDNSGSGRCDIINGYEAAWVPPVLGNYTQTNMGSGSNLGTASSSGAGIFLRDSVQSGTFGDHCRLLWIATPTAPWTLIGKILPFVSGQAKHVVGFCYYDSSSHKMADIRINYQSNGLTWGKWTDYNTFSADYASWNGILSPLYTWFKLNDNNTNRITSVSVDGTNWIQAHSVSRTDFMTANAAGFYVNANNSNGGNPQDAGALLLSWNVTSP